MNKPHYDKFKPRQPLDKQTMDSSTCSKLNKTNEEIALSAILKDPDLKSMETLNTLKSLYIDENNIENEFFVSERPEFDNGTQLEVDISKMPYQDSLDHLNLNFSKKTDPKFKQWEYGPGELIENYEKMTKRQRTKSKKVVKRAKKDTYVSKVIKRKRKRAKLKKLKSKKSRKVKNLKNCNEVNVLAEMDKLNILANQKTSFSDKMASFVVNNQANPPISLRLKNKLKVPSFSHKDYMYRESSIDKAVFLELEKLDEQQKIEKQRLLELENKKFEEKMDILKQKRLKKLQDAKRRKLEKEKGNRALKDALDSLLSKKLDNLLHQQWKKRNNRLRNGGLKDEKFIRHVMKNIGQGLLGWIDKLPHRDIKNLMGDTEKPGNGQVDENSKSELKMYQDQKSEDKRPENDSKKATDLSGEEENAIETVEEAKKMSEPPETLESIDTFLKKFSNGKDFDYSKFNKILEKEEQRKHQIEEDKQNLLEIANEVLKKNEKNMAKAMKVGHALVSLFRNPTKTQTNSPRKNVKKREVKIIDISNMQSPSKIAALKKKKPLLKEPNLRAVFGALNKMLDKKIQNTQDIINEVVNKAEINE